MRKMESYSVQSKTQVKTFSRILKLIAFFTIIFAVIFCITWQNIQVYLYEKKIEELVSVRNELEKEVYLLSIKASALKSRARIAKIATNKLGMFSIKPSDIKLIIY